MSSNGKKSSLLAFYEGNPSVTDGFPSQRPVTRSFDVFFDLLLNEKVEQTIETLVVWDGIVLNMTSL